MSSRGKTTATTSNFTRSLKTKKCWVKAAHSTLAGITFNLLMLRSSFKDKTKLFKTKLFFDFGLICLEKKRKIRFSI